MSVLTQKVGWRLSCAGLVALAFGGCFYSVDDLQSANGSPDSSVADSAADGKADASEDAQADVSQDAVSDTVDDKPLVDVVDDKALLDGQADAPINVGCAAATPLPFACADFEPGTPYGTFGAPVINGPATVNLVSGAAVAGTTILTIDKQGNGSGAQLSQAWPNISPKAPRVSFWLRVEQLGPVTSAIGRVHVNNGAGNTPQLDLTLKSSPTRLELAETLASGSSALSPIQIPVALNQWALVEIMLTLPASSGGTGSAKMSVTQGSSPSELTLTPLLPADNWTLQANANQLQVLLGSISSTGALKLSLDDVFVYLE